MVATKFLFYMINYCGVSKAKGESEFGLLVLIRRPIIAMFRGCLLCFGLSFCCHYSFLLILPPTPFSEVLRLFGGKLKTGDFGWSEDLYVIDIN